MKKIITVVVLVLLVIGVGVLAFNAGKNSQEPLVEEEKVNVPDADMEIEVEEEADYDYSKIEDGDFSDFAGKWKNDEGETINLKADGTEGSTSDWYYSVAESIEYNDNYYTWAVVDYAYEDGEGLGGYGIWLFPVGVEIVDEYTGKTIPSDTTQVRLYAGQDFFPSAENIYYKK